jgi:hypothetical protein
MFFILDTVLLPGNNSVTLMQEFSAILDVTRCQKNYVSTYSLLCRLYYTYLIKTTQTYIKIIWALMR